MLAKIAFLVAGFQHAAVLHHHANPARKMKQPQESLHRGGEYLGGPYLAAELPKTVLLVFALQMITAHVAIYPIVTKSYKNVSSYSPSLSRVNKSISFEMLRLS